jgi:hypothetical protein
MLCLQVMVTHDMPRQPQSTLPEFLVANITLPYTAHQSLHCHILLTSYALFCKDVLSVFGNIAMWSSRATIVCCQDPGTGVHLLSSLLVGTSKFLEPAGCHAASSIHNSGKTCGLHCKLTHTFVCTGNNCSNRDEYNRSHQTIYSPGICAAQL